MDINTQEKLQCLVNQIADLVIQGKITHKDAKIQLHQAIMTAGAALPKISILINNTYGGFAYSKQFQEFLNQFHYPQDQKTGSQSPSIGRVEIIPYIELFGQECKQRHELIAKMISTYHIMQLPQALHMQSKVKSALRDKDVFMDIKHQIECADPHIFKGSPESKVKYISAYGFKLDVMAEHFSQKALLDVCDQRIHSLQDTMNEALAEFQHHFASTCARFPDFYFDLLQSRSTLFEEERHYETTPSYMKPKWSEVMIPQKGLKHLSFIDAIDYYGNASHFAIWKCQLHYNEDAMRFLLQYPQYIHDDTSKCTAMEMGLLCASSDTFCKLAIVQVPSLVDWDICEYDGLESISISS